MARPGKTSPARRARWHGAIPRALPMAVCLALAACSGAEQSPRGFHLALSHPSPYATYIRVDPGTPGGALPTPAQIGTVSFSTYLGRKTGCAVNTAFPVQVLGNDRAPAGYMVPVSCP